MVNKTIQLELKNISTGAPPAGRSITLQLNNCESGSVAESVFNAQTGLYPAEVDQPESNRDGATTHSVAVPVGKGQNRFGTYLFAVCPLGGKTPNGCFYKEFHSF